MSETRNPLDLAVERAKIARRVAVITGAGISHESGIPTFRGPDGLWKNFRPEELASPEAFRRDPGLVWEWYDWRRGICAKAEPNPAHGVVAEMERTYPEFLLITQNVDGLHARAGNRKMVEIHGNIWQARCTVCGHRFENHQVPLETIPLHCEKCDGLARPHIVWFGESYDEEQLSRALTFLESVDLVFTIGTSGMVSMPVFLAERAREEGAFLVDVNPSSSSLSSLAHLFLQGKAGEELPRFWQRTREPNGRKQD